MSNLVAGAFDCDTHIYEPRDAVTRYLPKKYAEQSIRATKNADGKDVIVAGHASRRSTTRTGSGSTTRTGRAHFGRCCGDGLR